MGKKLEFFYDCSSPWTYLAFTKIEEVAARNKAELVWRPILVGGVFNAVNPSVYESRERPVKAKARYYAKDLQDWAHLYGLKIGQPTVFPVNSVKAMRGAFVALEHGKIAPYSRRVFESYWGEISAKTTSCAISCARSVSTSRNISAKSRCPNTRINSKPTPTN
jgi:2-hydroxychromene-2-carboxylate isomerase